MENPQAQANDKKEKPTGGGPILETPKSKEKTPPEPASDVNPFKAPGDTV
jgi:hypothetical protein